jgi:hypothetical protein
VPPTPRGAALAWQLALRHPDRVSRLAVISVGHPAAGAVAGGLEQRMRWWGGRARARARARASERGSREGTRPAQPGPRRMRRRFCTGRPTAALALAPRLHPRYLFLFADPGAEALVAADGWALFRELMGAAGARPGDVDAAIARLSKPGAAGPGPGPGLGRQDQRGAAARQPAVQRRRPPPTCSLRRAAPCAEPALPLGFLLAPTHLFPQAR